MGTRYIDQFRKRRFFLYGATPNYFLVLSHLHTQIIHSILQASSDRFFLAILTIMTFFLNTWRNSNLLGVLSHPFIAHPSPYRLRRLLSPRCRGEYFPGNYNLPPWPLWKIIFKAASSLRGFHTLHTTYEFFNGAGYFTL